MKTASLWSRLLEQEDLNFLLTNRLPRRWLTRMVGRISKSEHPAISRTAMWLWRAFADLDLSDARTTQFRSMHECFTRRLKDGARPIDANPSVIVSPSDGVVGACGTIAGDVLLQAKGLTYTLPELLQDDSLAQTFRQGCYATLRLTSSMYHRFHAPYDCSVERVTYIPGDMWNVNPAALKRVERLFCRNERAVLLARLAHSSQMIALVPVAAILVAGIRLHFLDVTFHAEQRDPAVLPCCARLHKGEEMGWFEHGSTIIVLAPAGFVLAPGVAAGERIRMGRPLFTFGQPLAAAA